MEKTFKIFLLIIVLGLFVSIFIVTNIPKTSITIDEEFELRNALHSINSNLPRSIGTIATMDSISYRYRTIIYNMTVFGDDRIKNVYLQNRNEFKDILMYSTLVMNGQHNMGDFYISFLEEKKLNIACHIYTQNGYVSEWLISGVELKNFADSCKFSPTAALRTIIDMHIEIANLNLPVKIEDLQDPINIKTVALNTFLGDIDETCLPQSISHIDNDIIFEYDIDDDIIDLNELEYMKDDESAMEVLASILAEDVDACEFIGIVALSHSDLVITYNGRKSHKSVSIRLPYNILRKYCKVPLNLFS